MCQSSLQKEKMSALDGWRTGLLTLATIKAMRNYDQFNLLYDVVVIKAAKTKIVGQPVLHKRRNQPKYSMLHHLDDCQRKGHSH